MAYDEKEFKRLSAKIAEMRRDEEYKQDAEERKKRKDALRAEGKNLASSYTRSGNFTPEETAYIFLQARNIIVRGE